MSLVITIDRGEDVDRNCDDSQDEKQQVQVQGQVENDGVGIGNNKQELESLVV